MKKERKSFNFLKQKAYKYSEAALPRGENDLHFPCVGNCITIDHSCVWGIQINRFFIIIERGWRPKCVWGKERHPSLCQEI